MIPPICRQNTRNRSNHHCINHDSKMTWRNARRDISRITYENSNKRPTTRNNPIYCIRNSILRIIFLVILPLKTITNNWTRVNLTTHRNSTIQPHTSILTKHSNLTSLTGRILMEYDVWRFFLKSVEKIQLSLKSEKNRGYFKWRHVYIFDHISLSSS
jgi:hypothetical protein